MVNGLSGGSPLILNLLKYVAIKSITIEPLPESANFCFHLTPNPLNC